MKQKYMRVGCITIAIIICSLIVYFMSTNVGGSAISKLNRLLNYNNCKYRIVYEIKNEGSSKYKIEGLKQGDTIKFSIQNANTNEYIVDGVLFKQDVYIHMNNICSYISNHSTNYGKYFNDIGDTNKYILINENNIEEIETLYGIKNKNLDLICSINTKLDAIKNKVKQSINNKEQSLSDIENIFKEWNSCKVKKNKDKNKVNISIDTKQGNQINMELEVKRSKDTVMVPEESINLVDFTNKLMERYIEEGE